jgi:Mg2+ and Co2+ transporter CorA
MSISHEYEEMKRNIERAHELFEERRQSDFNEMANIGAVAALILAAASLCFGFFSIGFQGQPYLDSFLRSTTACIVAIVITIGLFVLACLFIGVILFKSKRH